jgi:hypothetical protein
MLDLSIQQGRRPPLYSRFGSRDHHTIPLACRARAEPHEAVKQYNQPKSKLRKQVRCHNLDEVSGAHITRASSRRTAIISCMKAYHSDLQDHTRKLRCSSGTAPSIMPEEVEMTEYVNPSIRFLSLPCAVQVQGVRVRELANLVDAKYIRLMSLSSTCHGADQHIAQSNLRLDDHLRPWKRERAER